MTTCLVKGGGEGSSITTMLSRDEVDSNRSGGFFFVRRLEIDVERGRYASNYGDGTWYQYQGLPVPASCGNFAETTGRN